MCGVGELHRHAPLCALFWASGEPLAVGSRFSLRLRMRWRQQIRGWRDVCGPVGRRDGVSVGSWDRHYCASWA